MPNVEQQRERLIGLLKQLFQLDQPDLDFGFYRIMHAKAGQVTKFLEDDLLGIIRGAFGEADEARVKRLREALEAARTKAKQDDVPEEAIENFKPVRDAREAYDTAKDSGSNEGDVYDHLYRFFERYYDNGDFMSRRYFARETDGKAAPYAVPYDGREVYLHWANRDQYYIKTSEYLTNFTFDPTQAKEFRAQHGALLAQKPLKVHCRVVSATEGEHNNVKASEQTDRYFIIHEPAPVKIETGESGLPELVIQFQYRQDPEKTGQEGTWRKKRLTEAADKVKALLPKLEGADDYATALMTSAPTDAEKDRTLLEKYLAQYTGRNTMDYFIHKDLGGFLRRELDFYIKNEVMRLDDIESADAPRVETYLAKIKVLRRIAQHLIDFVTQLEEFQKRLWLKKKLVVDTQYCISLDRIPERLHVEIANNDAQREAWVILFAIDELDGYSSPLSGQFLKANGVLPVDTALFDGKFSEDLISEIQDLDRGLSGVLIQSENFSALTTMKTRLQSSVDCIYIDPPYNTDAAPIVYKNGYPHSSWCSLIADRLNASMAVAHHATGLCITIDDTELHRLRGIVTSAWPTIEFQGLAAIKNNPAGRTGTVGFSICHEYGLFYGMPSARVGRLEHSEKQKARYKENDDISHFEWTNFRKHGGQNTYRTTRPRQFYPFYVKGNEIRIPEMSWDNDGRDWLIQEQPTSEEEVIWPIDSQRRERIWDFVASTALENLDHLEVRKDSEGKTAIYRKWRLNDEGLLPSTIWDKSEYSAVEYGTNLLTRMFGDAHRFSFPKSVHAVEDCLRVTGAKSNDSAIILDYFAGSGTTGHATLNLNRDDGGDRKFILVEMGHYFDDVTRPRVLKSAYSRSWRSGKPKRDEPMSVAFKYMRLETYEDALNNLAFRGAPPIVPAAADFARDYMLRYWLDFETKGSPSLLNIELFDDPTAYKLKIKKPGTDEYVEKAVDLVETFNWLIGLHVEHLDRWRGYDASFKREVDPELPQDTNTRLMLDGALKETNEGAWRFRKVEGYTVRTPGDHNDCETTLVVWRRLTGDLERDNLMLDEWFKKYRLSAQDTEFDVIYVNGSNNLPNLRQAEETWKVRLIEEAFHQAMWDVEV